MMLLLVTSLHHVVQVYDFHPHSSLLLVTIVSSRSQQQLFNLNMKIYDSTLLRERERERER